MTAKEQLEELLKDVPKTYNMVSAYSSVNIKDLEETVDRFKYVPNYQDLLKENNKQQKEIERLNHEADTYMKIAVARQQRIDKAIEYIENPRHEMSVKTFQELSDILRGNE